MQNAQKTLVKPFLVAVMASALVFTMPPSVDAGNGNGNGNADNNDRPGNGRGRNNRGANNRGEIASGLRNLNAANANENAFLNAAPNSNVGQLQTYRSAVLESSALISAQNDAASTLLELQTLTPEQISALYPDGNFEAVLAQATQDYLDATSAAQTAEGERLALLNNLTGGRELTPEQTSALYELLGL